MPSELTTPAIADIAPVTYQNIGVATGFLIVQAGSGGQVNIYNGDIVNVLLVSPSPTPSLSNSLPIQPLTNATIDGTKAQYASALSGTCSQVTVGAASQLSPSPAQIAAQIQALGLATEATQQLVNNNVTGVAKDTSVNGVIPAVNNPAFGPSKDTTVAGLNTGIPNNIATTGVPLLTKSTLVKNQAAVSQNAGTVNQSATFSMGQIGYEIFLNIFCTTGNFLSFYHLGLSWFDSATGIQTGQEDYWFVPGSGAGANSHSIIGSGPTKGDQLIITSEVPATSSAAVTHSYVVLQNSRVYAEDNFETIVFNPAGVTGASTDMTAGILAASSFSVPANSVGTRLMPFFNGNVSLWFSSTSGLADLDVQIVTFADALQVGGTTPTFFEQRTNANGFGFASQVSLPAVQCQVQLNNTNAAAKTIAFTAIKSIQR